MTARPVFSPVNPHSWHASIRLPGSVLRPARITSDDPKIIRAEDGDSEPGCSANPRVLGYGRDSGLRCSASLLGHGYALRRKCLGVGRRPERCAVGSQPESPLVTAYSSNRARLRKAIAVGTRRFLRSGDALYAALAEELECEVVAWDVELVERAGALTPGDWIARNT